MIVESPNETPNGPSTSVMVACSASPVTMPGSAIGRITAKVITSRPKNEYRATAREASVPRTRARAVATRAARIDSFSASRTLSSLKATENQRVL